MSRYRVGAGSTWRTYRTLAAAQRAVARLRARGCRSPRLLDLTADPPAPALRVEDWAWTTLQQMDYRALRAARTRLYGDALVLLHQTSEDGHQFVAETLQRIHHLLSRPMHKTAPKRRSRKSPPVTR